MLGAIIPRPITVTGRFVAAPALLVPLTAPDSGIVDRVYVREGTRVEAGMPLVAVRDLDLERAGLASGAPGRLAGRSRGAGPGRGPADGDRPGWKPSARPRPRG